jgi:hypothetical protein
MIVSKVGVLYAAHTGGKIGVSPREGGWEMVDSWGNPGAPGGKHPAPTVRHDDQAFKAATKIQEHAPAGRQESIEILEAVAGKPVLFKINNRPSSNDAWVGIYPLHANDQDHGAQNSRWKWLRDINVNNASFPKQSAGSHSIRVFSDGGHTLHERKDFTVEAKQLDPAAAKSTRKKAWIGLAIGLLLLAPGIPLFIMGLGGGFQYEAVSSGTFEIVDSDGQGDFGFEIFIEGVPGDFDGDGRHNYCKNIVITANHTGGWFSTGPHGEIVAENPPDESRNAFDPEIAHEGSGDCRSHHHPEQASHNGVQLVKIGRACKDCMNGTTTITAQNGEGGEILMWIRTAENQETLGMLIPGAIMMGIGALTVIGSLGILAKTRHSHGGSQTTSTGSNPSRQGQYGGNDWFIELVKESEAISLQLSQPDERSYHERSTERMKYPDKEKVEEDIRLGNSLQKWYAHWLHDAEKSSKIAEALGLGVGGAGSDFTGKWRTDGLFAYRSGKYNGYAYFGTGGSDESRLGPIGDDEKYRPWNRDDPNMPKDIRGKLLKLEEVLARSYYLDPPK